MNWKRKAIKDIKEHPIKGYKRASYLDSTSLFILALSEPQIQPQSTCMMHLLHDTLCGEVQRRAERMNEDRKKQSKWLNWECLDCSTEHEKRSRSFPSSSCRRTSPVCTSPTTQYCKVYSRGNKLCQRH